MWKINRKDKFLNSGMIPDDMEDAFPWDDEDNDDDYYDGSDQDLGGTGHGDDSLSDADNYL